MRTVLSQQSSCRHLLVSGFGAMGDGVVCCKCGVEKYPEALSGYEELLRAGRVFVEGDENYDYLSAKAVQARDRVRGDLKAEMVWDGIKNLGS